jgi:hypothetical protein
MKRRSLTYCLICVVSLAAALVFYSCQPSDLYTRIDGTLIVSPHEGPVGTTFTASYRGSDGDKIDGFHWGYEQGGGGGSGTPIVGTKYSSQFTATKEGTLRVSIQVSRFGYKGITSDRINVYKDWTKVLAGTISVNPKSPVPVGTELTADWGSMPNEHCYWYKGGEQVGEGRKYTPTTIGQYTVYGYMDGYEGSKTSSVIEVMSNTTSYGTYVITGIAPQFTATKNGEIVGQADRSIEDVMDYIKRNAKGFAITIQFGSGGTNVLDLGPSLRNDGYKDSVYFYDNFYDNTDNKWGIITLTGNVTSAKGNGTINISNNTVISTANIANTSAIGMAINSSGGTLTINSGNISALRIAIYNGGGGTLTINNGNVSATTNGLDEWEIAYAIANYDSSSIAIINGGTITATGSRAYAISGGTVTVGPGATINGKAPGINN